MKYKFKITYEDDTITIDKCANLQEAQKKINKKFKYKKNFATIKTITFIYPSIL